ncbi:Modification methylase HaeIII [compost metagenome]
MPKIIDLFAGAGGLSLGASRAGFEVCASVELDKRAMATHQRNFPNTTHIAQDVSALDGVSLLALSGVRAGELDGLIGGPPCQGFSSIGNKDAGDERNGLFADFFRLVDQTRPAFFVAENVPGILAERNDAIREQALRMIPNDYQILAPIEVQANLYGAPTSRTRIFFIGYQPRRFDIELTADHFAPPDDVELAIVATTLQGLPLRIDCRWQTEELGWRPATACGGTFLADRITNYVPTGVGDPRLLARYLEKGEVSGCLGTRHSVELRRRYRSLKYGEMDVASRSRRLDPNGFCPTLRAGTGADKGSYQAVRPIHYSAPRVITPREAARLQGFPDWFVFDATKWHSFRQIGNSVSPIVAERILTPLRHHLR